MLIGGTDDKMQANMFIHRFRNQFYGICCYIFRTFKVIFSRLEVPMQRYGRICSFAKLENGLMTFAVLFLELCRVLRVDWR